MMPYLIAVLVLVFFGLFLFYRPKKGSKDASLEHRSDADLLEPDSSATQEKVALAPPQLDGEVEQDEEPLDEPLSSDGRGLDEVDYNERFLRQARGRNGVKVVTVYSNADLLMVRSLLASEGINSRVDNEHMNSMFSSFSIPDTAISKSKCTKTTSRLPLP